MILDNLNGPGYYKIVENVTETRNCMDFKVFIYLFFFQVSQMDCQACPTLKTVVVYKPLFMSSMVISEFHVTGGRSESA